MPARQSTPIEIGEIIMVSGAVQLLAAPIAAFLESRLDGRLLLAFGYGLFGIGLDAYWPQFPGLEARLQGYTEKVARRLTGFGAEVVNVGLIDTPEKAAVAGHDVQTVAAVRGWRPSRHPDAGLRAVRRRIELT